MERRGFLGTLLGGLLSWPIAAGAQPRKVHRVGHLAASAPSAENTRLLGAFQAELRERGWVEGQNIAYEYRWAEDRYERLPSLASELAEARVDLIVAGGTPNALAAQPVTRTIPTVMVGATTPVEVGLVKTLARPGGNITGVTFDVSRSRRPSSWSCSPRFPASRASRSCGAEGIRPPTGTGRPSSGPRRPASVPSASSRW